MSLGDNCYGSHYFYGDGDCYDSFHIDGDFYGYGGLYGDGEDYDYFDDYCCDYRNTIGVQQLWTHVTCGNIISSFFIPCFIIIWFLSVWFVLPYFRFQYLISHMRRTQHSVKIQMFCCLALQILADQAVPKRP